MRRAWSSSIIVGQAREQAYGDVTDERIVGDLDSWSHAVLGAHGLLPCALDYPDAVDPLPATIDPRTSILAQ